MLDENGQRTDFKLDLIEKQRDNMMKTGIWTPDSGVNYTMTIEEADSIVVKQLQNMTLRVVTVEVHIDHIKNFSFSILKECFLSRTLPSQSIKLMMFQKKPWNDYRSKKNMKVTSLTS